MSENTNPLTDFLEGGDSGNSLFDDLPFPTEEKEVTTAEEVDTKNPCTQAKEKNLRRGS